MNLLAEILSSRVRAEILRLLFDGGGGELHMRDIERKSVCAIGTIQTELKKLTRLDLVDARRDGNRLYYRARTDHPLYPDLCGLVRKTVGLAGLLHLALVDCPEIDCAFVFGSLATDFGRSDSDVDLMVIGSIGLRVLSGKLSALAEECGREINPYILPVAELRARMGKDDHFLVNVMKSPKFFVKGGEDDLARLAG